MSCPYCGLDGRELFPSEDGPRSELLDGPVPDAEDVALTMTHRVYCPREDREFHIVYAPRSPMPSCPACESDFDVVPEPPESHFTLTFGFEATTRCASCDEPCGRVSYEAVAVRDGGVLGH
jgi:hypothetical protein